MKKKFLATCLIPLLIPGCVGPTNRQYAQILLMGCWGVYAVTLWASRPLPPHKVGRFYWTWVLAAFFFGGNIYGACISAEHRIGDWPGPSLAWFSGVFLQGVGILVLGTVLAILYAPVAWVLASVIKIERKPDTKLNFLFVFTATSLPFVLLILVLAFSG